MEFDDTTTGQALKDLRGVLVQMFRELFEKGLQDFQEGDKAMIYLNQSQLYQSIIFQPWLLGDMNPEVIMEAVENDL